MAKQYKTWELIKAWQEGERGEFKAVNSNTQNVLLGAVEITLLNSQASYFISLIDKKVLWEKVQKPVDFMTALNSGKRIKPVEYPEYLCACEHLKNISYYNNYKEVLNGKWLIEEE